MAGGVGNLSVGLGLDYAAYTAGLTKAQAQAQAFAQQTKATFVGVLGAGLFKGFLQQIAQVPEALTGIVKGAIDAADHLNDLSKKTGIAADTLGGIGFAAKQAGGDLDSAAAGIGKLNKSIAEAAAGNKEAAAGFDAIGVSVKDASGQTKSADQVLSEVADKFASYADGPEKAALALKLFGKAGAEMIPLLDEGGAALQANIAYFKRYSGVTTETAKNADQFNDTLTKISLLTKALATTIASELLVPLQAVANRFLEAKEQGTGFAGFAKGLKSVFIGVAEAASFVVESLAVMSARLTGLIERAQAIGAAADRAKQNNPLDVFGSTGIFDKKLQGEFEAIKKVQDESIKAAQTRHDHLSAALNFSVTEGLNTGSGRRTPEQAKKPAPRLPVTGAIDDPTRKLLEAQLKAIDSQIQQEADLLQTRNRFLDFYNQQSLLSIQDYYSGRTAAQADALQKESALINQEIALLRSHQGSKGLSKTDQAADEVKIQELIGKRTKLEQQAGEQTIFLAAARERAYKELADQILGVSAQVLDLRENFALAAAVRFDLQFDALSKTFTANGNAAGLEAIATLRAAAIAQGAFQKASLDASRTLDDLGRKEDRVAIAQTTGVLGELEGMVKLGEVRRAQIPLLEAQVAAQEAIARAAQAAGTAGAVDLAAKADASRVALEKLKAAADPLAKSLNETFGRDFNSALDDFVTGTKSAADAFHSFAKSVLNDILKLGSKSITDSLFGGSGGIGGAISGLFSSGSTQGASGGLLSAFASLFSGFFATGGFIPAGQMGVVGENGPELAFGGRTGQTITPVSGAVHRTNYITVNVPANAGREYGTQVGADIARQLAIADRRNN